MRAELADLNHCAVPFLSRAATNLYWFVIIYNVAYFRTIFCNCVYFSLVGLQIQPHH